MNNTTSNDSHKHTSDLEAIMAIRDRAMQKRSTEGNSNLIEQWDASVDALNMIIKIMAYTEGDEATKRITDYAIQAAETYTYYLGKPGCEEHQKLYATALTYYQITKLLRDLQVIQTMRELLEELK